MKVEIKEKVFNPITLTITIESEQDLCNLWYRQNLAVNRVNELSKELKLECTYSHDFWDKLDELVKQHKLKRS